MLRTRDGTSWGTVALAAVLGLTSACGGDAHSSPDAQAAPPDGAGPQTITIKIFSSIVSDRGETANATLVGFQDGDQPWAALQGDAGIYHATASGGRYAVAVGCQAIPGLFVERGVAIDYRAVADGTEVDETGCGGTTAPPQFVTLSGTLRGITAGELGEVTVGTPLGGFGAIVNADGRYQVAVPTGEAIDVFARSFASGPSQSQIASKLYRSVRPALTADQTLDLDLDSEGAAPQAATLALGGASSDTITITSSVVTPATFFDVARQRYAGTSPTNYQAPAAGQLEAGDLISLHVSTLPGQSSAFAFRNATTYRATAASQTIALPPPWIVNPPTVTSTPLPRPSLTFPIAAGAPATQHVNLQFSADLRTTSGQISESRYLSVSITQRYADGQSTFAFTMPDLSVLSGWDDGMALPTGTTVFWNASLGDDHVASQLHKSDGDLVTASGVGGQLSL